MGKKYKKKLQIEGEFLILTEYEEPVYYGHKIPIKHHNKDGDKNTREIENQKHYWHKTRQKIITLIRTNFSAYDKHIILTFNEDFEAEKVENFLRAISELERFIKELKKLYDDLKLIATFEIGKEKGRFHFHIIVNLPPIKIKKLKEIWGNGRVWIKTIMEERGGVERMAIYVTKQYKYKDNNPLSLIKGKSRYKRSRNLSEPLTLTDEEVEKFMNKNSDNIRFINKNSYSSYQGCADEIKFRFNQKIIRQKAKPKEKANVRAKKKATSIDKVRNARKILGEKASIRKIANYTDLSVGRVHKILKDLNE